MSKSMLAILLLASAVIYDPPHALGLFGPQAHALGMKMKSVLDANRILPQFARMTRR